MRPFLPVLFFFVAGFISCRQIDTFEKNTVVPGMKWESNFYATGSFTITDTSSAYMLFAVIRHTDAYRYNNIWLNAAVETPSGEKSVNRVNLILGSDAGGWEGAGMSDIWEVRKPLTPGAVKLKKGMYRFSLQQIMRDDPLENVLSAGLRVEKQDNK